MTVSIYTQPFALKRNGQSPLRFHGALLVQGSSHKGHGLNQGRSNEDQASVSCSVAVFESESGFVAHISLITSPLAGELSFVRLSEDPVLLRSWFADFDPAIGVDFADVLATTKGLNADCAQTLAEAAAVMELRLSQARGAYCEALHTAFGGTTETKLAA